MPIYLRGSHGTLHERAPHIFLARPVQPAELVKCVRELLEKELGKLCLERDEFALNRFGILESALF